MPGKWGGARRVRPPLDPPMNKYFSFNLLEFALKFEVKLPLPNFYLFNIS